MKRAALLIAIAGLTAPALAQDQAPKPLTILKPPGAVQPSQPAKSAAKAAIYDERADAKQQIAAALAKAKKENQRVLVQWGGNWCHWCHLLHERFAADAGLRKELMYEYQLVLIDAGGKDKKNMDLASSYGADLAKHGFPYLTVLDASGKAIANQETGSLEIKDEKGESVTGEGAGHDAKKVLTFLKGQEAAHLQADAVVKDGIDQAKASRKKVFLHFGAPWCGWCHRLEDWLAQDEIGAIFGKDYVDVKVDQDRMVGAAEVEAKYEMPKDSGIPWFLILDPTTGKTLATSTGPKGNIGYPGEDEEIQHFLGMLEKTSKNMTPADIEKLKASLIEASKRIKGAH